MNTEQIPCESDQGASDDSDRPSPGKTAAAQGQPSSETDSSKRGQRLELNLMIICGVSLIAGIAAESFAPFRWLPLSLYALCYATGGYFGVIESVRSLRAGKVDVDLLMVLAALGAAYVGAAFEGGMLLFLFSLSNVLQSHALDRSRKAIRALMKLRPTELLCQSGSGFELRPIESVEVGTIARLRPGDRIALDGQVTEGQGDVDESSLTGESMPVQKSPGSELFAGTINLTGSLLFRITKRASESTLARIIAMVEKAQARKARTERFLEKAEQYYAVGVILFTLALIALPPLLAESDFSETFYRAMTVMVVASPCALIISTPAAFLAAIAGAAKRGALFKGGVHLERLAAVDTIAFDKTGTLTEGKPTLTAALPFPLQTLEGSDAEERRLELIRIAASLESQSEHPIARAIERAASDLDLKPLLARDFQAIPGKGAWATLGDASYLIGRPSLIAERGGSTSPEEAQAAEQAPARGETALLVARLDHTGRCERAIGLITVADTIRPEAREAIAGLKALGIRKIVMLTGDARPVAEETGRRLGIDEVHAELLPEDKLRIVERLTESGKVAMVGDGVNDAPALAAAHVGIAMGAAGTDVAMETADVVLMSNHLGRLLDAVSLARKSRRVVAQNLSFSLAVILTLVSLSLSVGIPLPLGVVGHEGSTVLVCLNGLRLLAHRSAR
ncbi:heavy metal translocating P-type ATPase [Pelagicoccus sp. SDUM812003]|uniref:heavy metal translocating P-type ATPase n=1 Tax=Pelagicoccus sp. SDUM812003 TaxID=3041267 RepID=UPI00280EAD6C|nr:heavy metal translocating P-type ATPase [Pelagicoccus sp. SDUM812003]MDQ8205532.1 heavy metal translocating P-type ATPase [Pelagicoccus sp. SDUM812003]